MALDTGDAVPDLALALSGGQTRQLAEFRGRWLVLYFYPKDSTPGCTSQGVDFNALLPQFDARGTDVLGVSRDSLRSHRNFRARHGFGFELVSDPEGALCGAFGVIRPRKLYGREYVGIERSTFLVDAEGRIARSWRGVRVPGHAHAVLDAVGSRTG